MRRFAPVMLFVVAVFGAFAAPQDDDELKKLKAENELLAERLKKLQTEQSISGFTSPNLELKRLQDQNALLAERLKQATTTKSLADATAPANTQLQRLTDENAILDQQVKLATSTKSLADASVPKFTGGLEGTTTISGDASVESVQLAYEALSQAAKGMAADLQHCGANDRIMIFNAGEIAAFDGMNAFRLQSRVLNDLLRQTLALDDKTVLEAPGASLSFAPLGLLMAGPIIQSLIDFTKLFRVNREITTKDLTSDEKAFLSILATQLKQNGGCHIYHPELMPARVFQELAVPSTDVPDGIDQSSGLNAYLSNLDDETQTASFATWLSRVLNKTAVVRVRSLARTEEKVKVDQEIEKSLPEVKKWREQAASIPSLTAKVEEFKKKVDELAATLKEREAATPVDKPAVAKARKDLAAARKDLEAKTKEKADAEAAKVDQNKIKADDLLRRQQRYTAKLADLLKALTVALDAGTAYRSDLLKSDSGANLLSRLSRTSRLESELKAECPKPEQGQEPVPCSSTIVHLSVQKLSAATLKKTGTFTGTSYTFSGGAIATYLQFGLWEQGASMSGELIGQGSFVGYSGQHSPGPETAMPPVTAGKLGGGARRTETTAKATTQAAKTK